MNPPSAPAPTVRPAGPDDLPAVLAMKNAAWRETYAHLLEPGFLAAQEAELPRAVEAWTRLLGEPGMEVWLAEGAGVVVGMAAAGPADDPALGPEGRELIALYVRARLHGAGLGAALLRAAVGGRPARLDVLVGNERAIAFYERHSFVAVGEPAVLGGPWGDAREQRMVRR